MIKPTILFLLILGISGYLFLDGLSKHHFKLKRTNGYHTFFKSTAYGLFLYVIASLLHFFFIEAGLALGVEFNFGYWALTNSVVSEPSRAEVALCNISFISLILGYITPKLRGVFFSLELNTIVFRWIESNGYAISCYKKFCTFRQKLKQNKESELRHEFLSDVESPEFSRLIAKASDLSLPILFTMSDRKVYVGYPYEITGGALINDLLVVPLVSGYRCSKTNKLHIVTRYIDIVQEIKEIEEKEFKEMLISEGRFTEEDIDLMFEQYPNLSTSPHDIDNIEEFVPYLVSLPYREIVHAHIHNLDQFEMFKQKEEGVE